MNRTTRSALAIAGLVSAVAAFGFATRQPWATALWPWPDGRLSFIFVGSIAASIAAANLWIAASGELRAAAPGALNLALTFVGWAGTFLWLAARDGGARLVASGAALLLATGAALGVWWWSRAFPQRDTRPLPPPVRLSFALFGVLLVLVGGALVARAPHIFPWPLRPDSSSLFGWIFLGAAVYFFHGLLWPSWSNAAGQLLGFLAYDLVLIGPFLGHFGTVAPEHRLSLIVYTAVLCYSGALAVFYLFAYPPTRLRPVGRQDRRVTFAAP